MKYTSNNTYNNWQLPDDVSMQLGLIRKLSKAKSREHSDSGNGRLYDSKLARFLSPDPVLQDPSNTQNYNRYSYCLNNPFRYYDPSGYEYDDYDDSYWGDEDEIPPGGRDFGKVFGPIEGPRTENMDKMSSFVCLQIDEIEEHHLIEKLPINDYYDSAIHQNGGYIDNDTDNKSTNGDTDDYRNDDFNNIWNWDFEFNDDKISKIDDYYVNEQPNGHFTYSDLDGRFSKNETWAKHQDDSQDESNAELTTYALVCHFFENLFGLNNPDVPNIPNDGPDDKQRIPLPEDQRFVVDSIDYIGDKFIILYTGGDSLIHTNEDAAEMLKNGDWAQGWLK